MATVYFQRLFPDARIIAFEPDPTVFAVLSRNIETCCGGSIHLVRAAVWDQAEGWAEFFPDGADAGRLSPPRDDAQPLRVRTVRLRDFLEEPVEFLKLDVEGAEVDILRDCSDRLKNVSRMFVEYHSFESKPQNLCELLSILKTAGFRIHIKGGLSSSQPFVGIDTQFGMDFQVDIFAYR